MATLQRAKTLLNGQQPVYPVARPTPIPGLPPLTNVGRPAPAQTQMPAVTPIRPPPGFEGVNATVAPSTPTQRPVNPNKIFAADPVEAARQARLIATGRPVTGVNDLAGKSPATLQPPVPPPVAPPVAPPAPATPVQPIQPPPVTPIPQPPPVTGGLLGNAIAATQAANPPVAPTGGLLGNALATQQPPPVPPPVTPPPNDGGVSEFGPGNDLRYTQFAPQASDRLSATGGMVDTARNTLATAPDRQMLALETLKLAEEQGDPAYQQRVRQVGQNAAKWGRIGSGMTTSELGDVETTRARDIDQLRRGVSLESAGQTLADRTSNLQTLGALETDQFNKEAAKRGELRGERGYESDVAAKALEDSIRQRQLEEDLTQGAYGRQMGKAQLGLQGAQISAGNADQSQTGVQDFLTQLALEESLRKRQAAGGG